MRTLLLCLAAIATPAVAKKTVSLLPFETTLGFAPARPTVIGPDHPFYRSIEVAPIVGMPDKLGAFLIPYTKRPEVQEALTQTMASANLLAPQGTAPSLRLTATWLGFDAPAKWGSSAHATVSVRYELTRIASGEVIFRRDITTEAEARGGEASERLKGTARSVILASLASATWCIERSPLGGAPADCALHPVGSFDAPITVVTPIYR